MGPQAVPSDAAAVSRFGCRWGECEVVMRHPQVTGKTNSLAALRSLRSEGSMQTLLKPIEIARKLGSRSGVRGLRRCEDGAHPLIRIGGEGGPLAVRSPSAGSMPLARARHPRRPCTAEAMWTAASIQHTEIRRVAGPLPTRHHGDAPMAPAVHVVRGRAPRPARPTEGADDAMQAATGVMSSRAPRRLTADDVLTAKEVAALLHAPVSTVEDWARRGILPSRKIGRRRLYIRQHIEAVLTGAAD